jgi:uncharacterized membrane protein YkoI
MTKSRTHRAATPRLVLASIVLGVLASGCATSPPPAAKPAEPKESVAPAPAAATKELPRTSDVAVAAFRREFPGAVVDEVVRPEGFANGDGVEPPLFWIVRHHIGAAKDETQVTPDGMLVHRQTKLATGDVPPAVAAAISAAIIDNPGGSPGPVTRNETMVRLGYVALATPHRSWLATVEKEGKVSQFLVQADGTVRHGGGDEEDEGDEADEKDEAAKPAAAPKEMEIPAEAARAVAAVKAIYPQAIVTDVETVPVDDGTGHFDVLQYEVEFSVGGAAKQTVATPDGIVLRVDRPAAMGSLPAPVGAAVAKETSGAALKSIVEIEERGDLRFLALAEPRVVYEVVLGGDGKKGPARFTPDGKRVQPLMPGRPAAESAKAAGKEEEEEDEGMDVREIAPMLKVALPDAIAAALASHAGEALEAGLEGEDGKAFVEVMIVDASGDAIEVKIDPATGAVLAAGKSDEEDEAGEMTALLKSLPAGHLPLAELARRAAKSVEGQMVSVAFVAKKEGGAVGAARFLVGKQMWKVTLDAASGAVLAKSAVADDDEDEDEKGEAPEKK